MGRSPLDQVVPLNWQMKRLFLLTVFFLLICMVVFDLGFHLTDSKMERVRNKAVQAITGNQLWESYSEQAVFEEVPNQTTRISGQFLRNPVVQTFEVDAPVSDNTRFHFKAYRSGERIWLYDFKQDKWFTAPVNHPELAELQQLQSPFTQWLLMIQDSNKVHRIHSGTTARYIFQVDHFSSGEIFGYQLTQASHGTLLVEVDSNGILSRLDATIDFNKDLLLRADQIHYSILFSNLNQTHPESLPNINVSQELP